MGQHGEWQRSGLRVAVGDEAGLFHPRLVALEPLHSFEKHSWRSRLEDLRNRGVEKLQDAQRLVHDRTGAVTQAAKQRAIAKKKAARDAVVRRKDRIHESMAGNPLKWAGIAAGSGIAIGVLGRIARWRMQRRPHHHGLVIIEATTC